MNIFTQIVEFIFFKRDVKDISYNPPFSVAVFFAYVGTMLLTAYQLNNAPEIEGVEPLFTYIPYAFMVVVAISFTGLYYALFAAQEKQARFSQTITAYYGSHTLLSLIGTLSSLIPAGILIATLAQAFTIICAVRATMQALEYSVLRAFFAIIGITMLASIIGLYTFPPVVNEAIMVEQAK